MNADLREKFRDILRDENGLLPTDAATDLLITVLLSTEKTDERWGNNDLPGVPSVTDYAGDAIRFLKHRYGHRVL